MDPLLKASIVNTVFAALFATQLKPGRLKTFCLTLTTTSIILTTLYIFIHAYTGAGLNDAFLFHLNGKIDATVFSLFWKEILTAAFLCFLLVVFARSLAKRDTATPVFCKRQFIASILALFFPISAIAFNPVPMDVKRHLSNMRFSVVEDHLLGIPEFFDQVKVPKVEHPTGKKKNFLYIYAESLEKTFFDQQRFPDLMPRLTPLVKKGLQIEGIKQAPQTGWTIAGMAASQCGVPGGVFPFLKPLYEGIPERTVPGVACWGDFLSQDDYKLVYMGGADLEFQSKHEFYYNQGFSEAEGMYQLLAQTPNLPVSNWGLYDDALIPRVEEKLEVLSEQDKPFGLIMLTLDVHGPEGFISPSCEGNYPTESGMLQAAHCNDKMLAAFLKRVLQNPKYKNLVVVLASDHLAMGNDAGLEADDPTRENLWVAFNTDYDGQVIKRDSSSLDLAPTFLSLLGYKTSAFAFGRNLFETTPTLSETYGREDFHKKLDYWRSNLPVLAKERAKANDGELLANATTSQRDENRQQ